MGNIGWPELLVIMFIVLLVFGAKRVPEIFRSLGSGIGEFKKGLKEGESKDPASGSAGSSSSSPKKGDE